MKKNDKQDILNEDLESSINETVDSLKGKFCENPFNYFLSELNGDIALCCVGWLPYYIGNINNESFEDILNSEDAQKIRASILDGSFKYCNHKSCPRIQEDILPNKEDVSDPRHRKIIDQNLTTVDQPTFVHFCNDESCNLSCPSCRIKKFNHIKGPIFTLKQRSTQKILDSLLSKPLNYPCVLSFTGSGDPFAAKSYRDFLFAFDGSKYPNIKINLQTNGVMFTPKYWKKLEKIHDNMNEIRISFDAATEKTYNITRRGGNWKLLVENVKFLSTQTHKMKALFLDFVVQDHNYKEMPAFACLAKSFGNISGIHFSMITNWGTFSKEEFNERAIWKKEHPNFDDFINVLKSSELDEDFIGWGNLKEYYKLARK